MRHRKFDAAQLKGTAGVATLLLAVFITEFATMELLDPFFDRLGVVPGALVDASIVVVVVALPVWLFFAQMVPGEKGDAEASHPADMLWKTSACIFLAEYLFSLLLPYLFPPGSDPTLRALADASFTAICSGLPLCWFLSRQKARGRHLQLLDTSLRLYLLLLCTVFLAELLQELIIPAGLFHTQKVVEAFVTTLCSAPLLWLLVVRPLKGAARSEKRRVTAVHGQVNDAIVTINTIGEIRSFNPAAEHIFGYSSREVIGRPAGILLVDEDAGLNALLASVTPGDNGHTPPASTEIGCRRKNGLILIMSVSISMVGVEEQEFLLIMRDVTQHKIMDKALAESEQRFREIFHQSEDAIFFFKPGGTSILDMNAHAERTFGYTKEELQAGGIALFLDPEDLATVTETISAISEDRNAQHNFPCRRRDGERIVVSLHGKIMHLQGVAVTYCTMRDITERIRVEEKTREVQASLIQANKMTSLGLLVSGVAHEINNPNNFVMANSDLLAKIWEDALKVIREYQEEHEAEGELYFAGIPSAELADHTRRLIRGIHEGAHRVDDIVNNLKDFARQERRQASRAIDVNQVARSAVSLLHHELIKFTHHFHLELAENLPPVKGHAQQLGQVIINLLMNACQALPGKDSAIWLSTEYDERAEVVTIAVKDQGCGIPREGAQKIMEPFFSTKLESGGTGLGLSISDSIVKEHGGELNYASEPGVGTIFWIRLPAAIQSPDHPPTPSLPAFPEPLRGDVQRSTT